MFFDISYQILLTFLLKLKSFDLEVDFLSLKSFQSSTNNFLLKEYVNRKKTLLLTTSFILDTMEFQAHFFQEISTSHTGYPWVSGNHGGSIELDLKGYGCNHEVLGMLGTKNPKTRPKLLHKFQFLEKNSLQLQPNGCSQIH